MKKFNILHTVNGTMCVKHDAYGGTEIFAYYLDKALVERGHKSKVIARSDSELFDGKNRLMPILGDFVDKSEFRNNGFQHQYAAIVQAATELETLASEKFDVVHSHASDTMRLGKLNDVPVVTTLHYPVEWFWNKKLFGDFDFGKNKFVAVSNFQKKAYEQEGYKVSQVIYNGIDADLFKFNESKKNYLFFLGRIHPEKGVEYAISVALATGYDLIIAGDVITQQDYFNKKVLPHITHDLSGELNKLDSYLTIEEKNQKIIYAGHVNRHQMIPLYQNAKAFLMTSVVGESCPLVALESLSCGTPVLCFNKGSLPELVKDGITGFVVDNVSALADSVKLVEKINPLDCRLRVENEFTHDRLVQEYVHLYSSF